MILNKRSTNSLLKKFGYGIQNQWKSLVLGVPLIWLSVFFLVPFLLILKISLAESVFASPPFSSMLDWSKGEALRITLVFESYGYLFDDDLYSDAFLNSIKVAFISTIICLLISYPMAYGIVRSSPTQRNILLILIILPFWTSFLLRVYAWMGILSDQGTLNNFLIGIGLIDEPIQMLYTPIAVYIGIIYSYLPFMVLPLYANIERIDWSLLEASADLGAKRMTVFLTVTLPLTVPGIIAGCLLVFIPATGEYVIPDLLGGGNSLMIGKLLYSEFNNNSDWPTAAAVAMVLLFILVLPMMLYQKYQSRADQG